MTDNSPLESNFLTQSLDSAQERVEERAYQQRKNLFDYDDILNKQRNICHLYTFPSSRDSLAIRMTSFV